MTDEALLKALSKLIDDKIDKKLADQEQRLLSNMKILLENDVQAQINLIAEDVKAIREQLPVFEEQEALRNDAGALKAVVKLHSEEIQALKKAQ